MRNNNPVAAEFEQLKILPWQPAYALVQLRHFRSSHSYWAGASLLAAQSLGALQRWVEARDILREMVWLFPVLPATRNPAAHIRAHAWSEMGRQYGKRGHFRQAEAWLLRAAGADPKDFQHRIELVEIFARQGRWSEAQVQLDIAQGCPEGHQEDLDYWRGWILRGRERWLEAVEQFHRCPWTDAAIARVDIELALQEDWEAVGAGPVCDLFLGRKKLVNCPEEVSGYWLQAHGLAGMGRSGDAWKSLRRAWHLAAHPGYRKDTGATLHRLMRHYRKAAETFESLSLVKRRGDRLTIAGCCWQQAGEHGRAEGCFREALLCEEVYRDDALLGLAEVLRSMERFEEAEASVRESLLIEPECRKAQLLLEDVVLTRAFLHSPMQTGYRG